MALIRKYDTRDYKFRELVELYLEFSDLEQIHVKFPFEEKLLTGTDQNRNLHKKFYQEMDSDRSFIFFYKKFIKEVVAPLYDDEIIYQKYPTFRVHQPNNLAVFAFHKDRDYRHNSKEVNFYLPITEAFDTNTFWYETKDGKKDFRPMEARYGELIEWDGANLEHGNKPNETGQTRISFDFRILRLKDYDEASAKESLSKGTPFKIGHYFDEINW
jgi:hypothetical protein